MPLPSPKTLCEQFERGEIEREELHAMMELHARALIAEMEEDRLNPFNALMEKLLTRQTVARLTRRHGHRLLREILAALAELPDFPPAIHLWNASHPDVPLHCFIRIRKEPRFRILKLTTADTRITVEVEFTTPPATQKTKQTITLNRDSRWQLVPT